MSIHAVRDSAGIPFVFTLPSFCYLLSLFERARACKAERMPTERMVARGTTTARATISDKEPPPFDPYAAEATAVLVAKSALSAAKDELRSVEHRTQALLAPPEEPFKAGAAPPAKGGAKPPPVDEAQEALVTEAQAAVAEAKLRVQACKAEHLAAEGTLRRIRLVQLAEKLEAETKAQKAAFREALRETSDELTEDVPKRAAAIEEERRRGAALRRARTRQDEAEYRDMIDPDLKRDQDALLVGPDAKFVTADFDERQVGNLGKALSHEGCPPHPRTPRAQQRRCPPSPVPSRTGHASPSHPSTPPGGQLRGGGVAVPPLPASAARAGARLQVWPAAHHSAGRDQAARGRSV